MSGQIVILAHADDPGAAKVLEALQAHPDLKPCLVRPEALALARWHHEIDPGGHARTRLTLPNRMELRDESVGCVLNRLQYVVHPWFARATQKDHDYANAELQALMCSWLAGLRRKVVNPILPSGMPATTASARRWLWAASAHGLPVARSVVTTSGALVGQPHPGERLSPRLCWPGGMGGTCGPGPAELAIDEAGAESSILIAGSTVRGPLASRFAQACLALARQTRHRLLELRFTCINAQARLVRVDSMPRLHDPDVIDAIARLLRQVALERKETT
jgi:hypothetical protein